MAALNMQAANDEQVGSEGRGFWHAVAAGGVRAVNWEKLVELTGFEPVTS